MIWLGHDLPTLVLNMSKNFSRSFSCSPSHEIYIHSNKIKLGSTYADHALWPLSYDLDKIQDRDKSANRSNGGITSIGNPIVEIRRSYGRLISTMGFPILGRRHLYIDSGPRIHLNRKTTSLTLCMLNYVQEMYIFAFCMK